MFHGSIWLQIRFAPRVLVKAFHGKREVCEEVYVVYEESPSMTLSKAGFIIDQYG